MGNSNIYINESDNNTQKDREISAHPVGFDAAIP